MSGSEQSELFNSKIPDGGRIHGVRGSNLHAHEYVDGLGIGHIKDQSQDRVVTHYNNFNSSVDAMLPTWMRPK